LPCSLFDNSQDALGEKTQAETCSVALMGFEDGRQKSLVQVGALHSNRAMPVSCCTSYSGWYSENVILVCRMGFFKDLFAKE